MVILDFLLEILYIDGIVLGYFNTWAVTGPFSFHTLNNLIMEQLTLFPQPETSDESIHAIQEQQEALDEWLVDLINGIEPEFWWIY
jgi:hypothetical protein